MKNITVKTQEELENLPIDFDGRIFIEFGTPYKRAIVNRRFKYAVEAWGNSSVEARENSSVVARENSSVVAWGNSQIVDSTYSHTISTSGNARIVYNPRNAREYIEHYGIENNEKTAKLYKAVHKRDGRYVSDWDRSFEYHIGETATASGLDKDTREECGKGIHMAFKEWCVDYGRDWTDLAILEVEVEIDGIVVPAGSAGKVRAKSAMVLREVPLCECGLLGKCIAKQGA